MSVTGTPASIHWPEDQVVNGLRPVEQMCMLGEKTVVRLRPSTFVPLYYLL